MHALELNHTWDLIPKPAGTYIGCCHWVFIVKHNHDGSIDHLKARLVARASLRHMVLITLRFFSCCQVEFYSYYYLPGC